MLVNEKQRITGTVIIQVYGPDGDIKLFPQTRWEKFWNLPGKPMIVENHNIVTNLGDALFVDALSYTPARIAPNSSSYMAIGTGFVSAAKTATGVNSISGAAELVDSGYPLQGGAWAASGDNILVFKTTFAAHSNENGIDEISLQTSADCVAYAEVSPVINITSNDTLVGNWYITFLGA